MTRQTLLEVAPLLGLAIAAIVALVVLTRLSRARFDARRLMAWHADERGAVQSLSFVMTIPAYVMILLFIIQLSQLTIAKVIVEYSAFAAARSAAVWIPASLGDGNETANQVAGLTYEGDQVDSHGVRFSVYQVAPGSPKYQRILYAAVLANTAISPSRSVGANLPAEGQAGLASLQRAYLAAAPAQAANPQIDTRLRNKLAYAWNNTNLEITLWHRESEPPLHVYDIPPYREEFAPGEVGWHDQVIVKVRHDFALLPGPGRFLARPATSGSSGSMNSGGMSGIVDRIAPQIRRNGEVYVYSITATATLHTDGEKPLLPFIQQFAGPLRTAPGVSSMARASAASAAMARAVGRSSESVLSAWEDLPLPPDPTLLDEACCLDAWPRSLSSGASGAPTPARREARP